MTISRFISITLQLKQGPVLALAPFFSILKKLKKLPRAAVSVSTWLLLRFSLVSKASVARGGGLLLTALENFKSMLLLVGLRQWYWLLKSPKMAIQFWRFSVLGMGVWG